MSVKWENRWTQDEWLIHVNRLKNNRLPELSRIQRQIKNTQKMPNKVGIDFSLIHRDQKKENMNKNLELSLISAYLGHV